MSTLTFDRRADPDGIEDDGEGRMPRRPRRRLLTRWSAVLLADPLVAPAAAAARPANAPAAPIVVGELAMCPFSTLTPT